MKKERYEGSFKAEAVNLALSTDQSYADVARDLGVKYSVLLEKVGQVLERKKLSMSEENELLFLRC